jgi:hypothetical protein
MSISIDCCAFVSYIPVYIDRSWKSRVILSLTLFNSIHRTSCINNNSRRPTSNGVFFFSLSSLSLSLSLFSHLLFFILFMFFFSYHRSLIVLIPINISFSLHSSFYPSFFRLYEHARSVFNKNINSINILIIILPINIFY